jgi:hypothetical protein
MNHRKQKMAARIGEFMRQYQRKAQRGGEPNDRVYSRKMEQKLKRMRPEEFEELLHGPEGADGVDATLGRKSERESRWSGR